MSPFYYVGVILLFKLNADSLIQRNISQFQTIKNINNKNVYVNLQLNIFGTNILK